MNIFSTIGDFFQNISSRIATYRQGHPKASRFISYSILANNIFFQIFMITITALDMNALVPHTGIVEYWDCSSGRYDTESSLKICGDTVLYRKYRTGVWMNFQHDGVFGEHVIFYTFRKDNKNSYYKNSYFGLGNINNQRSKFAIFFDLMEYENTQKLCFLWFILSFFLIVYDFAKTSNSRLNIIEFSSLISFGTLELMAAFS